MTCCRQSPSKRLTQPSKEEDSEEEDGKFNYCGVQGSRYDMSSLLSTTKISTRSSESDTRKFDDDSGVCNSSKATNSIGSLSDNDGIDDEGRGVSFDYYPPQIEIRSGCGLSLDYDEAHEVKFDHSEGNEMTFDTREPADYDDEKFEIRRYYYQDDFNTSGESEDENSYRHKYYNLGYRPLSRDVRTFQTSFESLGSSSLRSSEVDRGIHFSGLKEGAAQYKRYSSYQNPQFKEKQIEPLQKEDNKKKKKKKKKKKNSEGKDGYQPPAQERPTDQPPSKGKDGYQPPAQERPTDQPPNKGKDGYQPPAQERPTDQPPNKGKDGYQPPAQERPTDQPPSKGKDGYQPPAQERPTDQPPNKGKDGYQPPAQERPTDQPPNKDKDGYQPPAQERPTDQPPNKDKDGYQPPAQERPTDQPPNKDKDGYQPPAQERPTDQPPNKGKDGYQPPAQERPTDQPPNKDKDGYQPPAQERPTDQPPNKDKDGYQPPAQERPTDQPPNKDKDGYQPPAQERPTDQPSHTVPDEVVYDPYKLLLYKKAILKGEERENTLRINIVGNYAQGKTSLANRLIGKTCKEVTTTNGIEINKYRCHTFDDGSHTFKSFENENHEFANRVATVARSIEPTIRSNTDGTPQDHKQTLEIKPRVHMEAVASKHDEVEDFVQPAPLQIYEIKETKPMTLSSKEMATFSKEVEVQKDEPEKFIDIWDFGGQYIFYATHTLFHSKRALYVLVFDLTKSLDTVVMDEEFPGETGDRNMEYFARFWLESIHAYTGPDPQVILVGTHKDKLQGNGMFWKEYFENVRCLFDDTELIHHIQKDDFAVDNYDMSDPVIADLHEFILKKHQELVQHVEIPARWIQLEKSLRALKTSIISFQDVIELDKRSEYPLHDEEQLKLFLHYHHEKGTLFFYDEDQLSDSICLDPKFLIDAFKCIITSELFFQNDPDVRSLRITLSKEGRLSHQLIDKVWSKKPDFLKCKDVIIGFLKKQNIIAEVVEYNTHSEDKKQKDWFIVPSLLKDHSSKEEMMVFLARKPQSQVRYAMKFDQTSIVHQVFHKALAAALGIWPVVNCGTKQLLFENMCVFKLPRNHTGLLEQRKDSGTIELRVIHLQTKQIESQVGDKFRRFVESVVQHEFRKLKYRKEEKVKLFVPAYRCNHADHCQQGSSQLTEFKPVEDVICPDNITHESFDDERAKKEWYTDCMVDEAYPRMHLTEKTLSRLAQAAIGENWRLLGLQLQIDKAHIDHIENDHKSIEMQIYSMLLKWKDRSADKATLDVLIKAIKKCPGVGINWDEIRNIRDEYSRKQEKQEAEQQAAQQLPDQERTEVDSGPATEEKRIELVGEHGNEEVVEPLFEDKIRSKTYRPPKDACIFDGRLIKLEEEDIRILERTCINEIGRGGFGNVYSTSDYSAGATPNGFGMHVAVKKIRIPNIRNEDHILSVRREMITSRIMHPFVLPLLAVVDRLKRNSEFWFVSPLCKNGDLHAAIKGNLLTREITRVKILLHIALAIEYIHTKVPNVREVILHKDISSKNVVLDAGFNARLIDFGLAREKDDETTNVKGKVYYSHPDFGKHDATESWDYYSFGVIIREMLTDLEPQGKRNRFLKFMEAAEIEKILEESKEIKECVWSASGRDKKLNSIAEKCLQQNDWTVEDFNTTVVKEIKARGNEHKFVKYVPPGIANIHEEIWNHFGHSMILDVPKDHAKCHMCMINPKAKETSLTQEHTVNCRQKIEVCIACEKNSFLNPVTCYCGTTLQPVIGSRYGALLVAGNDLEDPALAEALTKDIMELKKLLTSRAPLIMGIRDGKVHVVRPSKPGQLNPGEQPEHLWPKVKECINVFSEDKDIDTLLIYFSCHGKRFTGSGNAEKDNSFELGSESITLSEFEEKLECLGKIDKLVIILDRCYPPTIRFKDRNRKFIQINACRHDQRADITNEGSIFTKYLIQGLKASSEGMRCSDNCKDCIDHWAKSTDFITASSLFDYVHKHMKKVKPTMDSHLQEDSSNFAFYTDEQVRIEFEDGIGGTKKDVPLGYLQKMEDLETKLLQEFGENREVKKVRIQRDTYRKENPLEECDTLEKVMSAWIHRQPLKVVFEPV